MSEHKATVLWSRNGAPFIDNRYSRGHLWQFDGGIEVPASSSPHVVPVPLSVASAVDPEEAFVASLSSCHMGDSSKQGALRPRKQSHSGQKSPKSLRCNMPKILISQASRRLPILLDPMPR